MKRCYILEISDNPGYLLFTAPYKLCEGGCEDKDNNFAMVFPIYVGQKGKDKYKELYERDYKNIHSTKPDSPFKKRPTKKLFTLCPSDVTKETTMVTTETETTLIETTINPTTLTVSDTETLTTNTPTMSETTTTETPTLTPTTDSQTTFSETETTEYPTTKTSVPETTMTEMMTAAETPTIADTGVPTTIVSTTNAPTTTVKITMTELPIVAETETITMKETTALKTEPSIETTNIPTTIVSELTETEDITFESYTDDNNISSGQVETTFVTNANGVICPSRICRKKIKVTPSIITLGNNPSREQLLRNTEWNSDYSDLQDYSDLYV